MFKRLLDAMKAFISMLSQSGMFTDEQSALYDIILGGDERITENRPTPEAFEDIMLNEDVESDSDDDYSPEKVGHGYKLFEHDIRTGKLYPLFIGSKEEMPIGKWMIAQNIPTKGFSNRPGWHIGSTLPDAPWLKGYSPTIPEACSTQGAERTSEEYGLRFHILWM